MKARPDPEGDEGHEDQAEPAALRPSLLRNPLYAQIHVKLRERIVKGRYEVGTLLPTEAELCLEFAASRYTVREALRRLAEAGFVRRRQGAGTVVVTREPVATFVQSFASLQDLFNNAVETHYALHGIDPVVLDQPVAERLGAAAGQSWLLVTGVRWTAPGGTPLAYIDSYIPAEFAPIVERFPNERLPFYLLLEEQSGRTIEEVTQEIRAVPMPARVANAFGLTAGSSALQLLRRYLTRSGILIASFNWHRGDQFTYRTQLHRRPGTSAAPER